MRPETFPLHTECVPAAEAFQTRIAPITGKEWPSLLAIGTFALIIYGGIAARWIGYNGEELNDLFGLFAGLWAFGHLAESLRARLLPDLCKLVAVLFLLALTAPLASAVLARTDFPLVDAKLASADERLFWNFSWPDMVNGFSRHPHLLKALSYSYASLTWQPPLLIMMLCLLRRAHFAWTFMSCWAVTLLISIATFPFLPALGGYLHFGIPQGSMPAVLCRSAWHYPVVLQHLRDGSVSVLGAATLEGIVAMPSFHAASAVLLGWAYWKIPYARWPFSVLNLLMWISAVPIGGHYLVDVAAGTGVAFSVIIVGRHFDRRDARNGWAMRPSDVLRSISGDAPYDLPPASTATPG